MSLSLISLAIGLADLVPSIARLFSDDETTGSQQRNIAQSILDISKRITGETDASLALKRLRSDPEMLISFQRDVIDLERELQETITQDRKSARSRDMAFISAGRSNTRADIMVVAAALGLLACLLSLAYFKNQLPGEAVGIISTVAGIFGSCLKDAYSFEFGSSRGSKAKDLANFRK